MNPIDNRIKKFINKHHVLTLSTRSDDGPWCCSCFYAYSQDENCFFILSEKNTRHIQHITKNNKIAGTIALETMIIGKIRGIQFSGIINELTGLEYKNAKKKYLKTFPYAFINKSPLWKINIEHIKMTDNRLGFGKKIIWNCLDEPGHDKLFDTCDDDC